MNIQSFQKVIDAVNKTGVGFKKFFFQSNIDWRYLVDSKDPLEITEAFPEKGGLTGVPTDGLFIMKVSDGEKHVGTFSVTYEQFKSVIEVHYLDGIKNPPNFTFVSVERLESKWSESNLAIEIHLQYGVCGKMLSQTAGYMIVEVRPCIANQKEWFQELPPAD